MSKLLKCDTKISLTAQRLVRRLKSGNEKDTFEMETNEQLRRFGFCQMHSEGCDAMTNSK